MPDLDNKFAQATGLTISNRGAWQDFIQQNGAPQDDETLSAIGQGVVKLAYEWARLMEPELWQALMDDVAWDCYLKADDLVAGGGTGWMAKTATYHLGHAWKYGAALVDWHNRMAEKPGTAPHIVGPIKL